MEIDLSALDAVMTAGQGASTGAPLVLPIDQIDEDADQPRTEFDGDSLQELAATIAERGVRQPISVRSHPKLAGRWLVNFGARRLRASRLAGRTEIPAFVDETADTYDQVIENEQREGLQPLELALFIERRLKSGDSQAEVARRLGKSRAYVTYLCSLIDAPAWLIALYRRGVCRGIAELHELARLGTEPDAGLQTWIAQRSSISRADIKAFKKGLAVRCPASDGVSPSVPVRAEPAIACEPASAVSDGDDADPSAAMVRHEGAGRPRLPHASGPALRPVPAAGAPVDLMAGRSRLLASRGDQVVEVVLDALPWRDDLFCVQALGGVDRHWVSGHELTLLRIERAPLATCAAPPGG